MNICSLGKDSFLIGSSLYCESFDINFAKAKEFFNLDEMNLVKVDIDGHPPIPIGSKQYSGNLLFLAVFRFLNFQGHFEGLNEVFWD
jgi:hypothetical protein